MAKSKEDTSEAGAEPTQEGVDWALDETAPRQVGKGHLLTPSSSEPSHPTSKQRSEQRSEQRTQQPREVQQISTRAEPADRDDQESSSASSSGILGQKYAEQESIRIPVSSASLPGQFPIANWDRYELHGLLGRGGMGAVYKATDRRIGRTVAIKFVRGDDERLTARFLQEARSQARIQHPGVCQVLEVGEVEAKPYIAMQYVDGLSLQQAKEQLSEDEKVRIIQQCAEALHAAHQTGIIHRDVKPANIMLERRADGAWHPVVMDFGIARDSNDTGITESGTVLGTASYMSPEQARGEVKRLDRRTDVYSLGATLFDLLAGRPPFVAPSSSEVLLKVMMEEAPPLRRFVPKISDALDIIVHKCLAKDPAQRYATAQDLADDLGRHLSHAPIVGDRVSVVAKLRWKAKHNPQLAVVVLALCATLLALLGYGVRTRIQTARMERQAREHEALLKQRAALHAQLAQRLGQEITKMEWLLRSARQLPIHDLEREKVIVRKRMVKLKSDLREYGDLASGLVYYAIGRGHLALHEYADALRSLHAAQQAGQDSAELHYALGIVLGKHYEQAMHEARLSGGGDWAQKQLREIAPKYLNPALDSLAKARSLQSDTPQYLEALIAYYQKDYDRALTQIEEVLTDAPWLYEALKLAGDIHHERALQARDTGKYELAETEFASAVRSYDDASKIAPSDAEVYEGLAETWIRQMEMAQSRSLAAVDLYKQAVTASNTLIKVDSGSMQGHLKLAFSAMMSLIGSYGNDSFYDLISLCIKEARIVLRFDKDSLYANEALASCQRIRAEYRMRRGEDGVSDLKYAASILEKVISNRPMFLWGLNDLSAVYQLFGKLMIMKGEPSSVEILMKALELNYKALLIDEKYLIGYQNMIYTELFLIANGSDLFIREALQNTDAAFRRCVSIDPQYQQCYLNYGEVYARAAWRAFWAGDDAQPRLEVAFRHLEKARMLGDKFLDLEQFSALAHWVKAAVKLSHKQDPTSELQALRAALPRCFALAATDAMCRTLGAQAEWLAAEWLALRGQAVRPTLLKARAAALLATQSPELYPDAWQALAETELRLAQAAPAGSTLRRSHIEAGRSATQKLFSLNPNHALGWATQSGLELLLAESDHSPRQKELAQTALASVARAQKLDPLLGRVVTPRRDKAVALGAVPTP